METQKTSPAAIASLVLGIISICAYWLTSIPAIICGHVALSKIRKSEGKLGGSGLAIAGLVMGYFLTLAAIPVFLIFALPAGHQLVRELKESQVRRTAFDLRMGIQNYYVEYKRYPSVGIATENGDAQIDSKSAIIATLIGIDETHNPRATPFFTARTASTDDDYGLWIDQKGNAQLLDHWGQPYQIIFDANYDDKLIIHGKEYHTGVSVWSIGPDGIDSTEDDIRVP